MLAEGRPLVAAPIQFVVGLAMTFGFAALALGIRGSRLPRESRAERWYLKYELTGAVFFCVLGVMVGFSGLLRLLF